MKKKKIIISLLVIVAIITIIGVVSIVFFNKDNKKEMLIKEKKNHYTLLLKINPLVQLDLEETCKEKCYVKVSKYYLLNDDAKKYFEEVDLTKNESITKVMDEIIITLKKNNVSLDNINIYTDFNKLDNFIKSKDYKYNLKVMKKEEIKKQKEDLLKSNETTTTTTTPITTTRVKETTKRTTTSQTTTIATTKACVNKKFSHQYSYVYDSFDVCKNAGYTVLPELIKNDSNFEGNTFGCEQIVDDCGNTYFGMYFLKNSDGTAYKIYR